MEETMSLVAKFAVYGALHDGASTEAEAFNVTGQLQSLMDGNAGVVTCNNASFGDPVPGFDKHFGALVNRDGTDLFFSCHEGQKIDFNLGGAPAQPSQPPNLVVRFAVYGALPGGDPFSAEAVDVTARLQELLNASHVVTCNDTNLGDPSVGNAKHFAAVVARDGADLHFACAENQTIDFSSGGT
jgi:hypothetical protein